MWFEYVAFSDAKQAQTLPFNFIWAKQTLNICKIHAANIWNKRKTKKPTTKNEINAESRTGSDAVWTAERINIYLLNEIR